MPDDLFPTIYKIDRIKNFQVLNEHFQLPYRDRFEEREFRKRVQLWFLPRCLVSSQIVVTSFDRAAPLKIELTCNPAGHPEHG